MAIGTGILKKQTALRAAFAEVVLDVEFCDHPVAISVSPTAELSEGEYYMPAVSFGVQYACNRIPNRDPAKPFLRVQVLKIRSMPCDSTEVGVAYCAVSAVFDALKIPPGDKVEYNLSGRRVSFSI